MEVLTSSPDQFGGVLVDTETLPGDPDAFRELLGRSLEVWRAEGKRLVWIDVPLERAALIPVAAQAGFIFHHSDERLLTMTCRLQEGAFIPNHATHYIGAGGVVINNRNELLVVCERHRRTKQPYYKLPGGALQAGEHL